VVSNLPFGSGVVVIVVSTGPPDHVSTLSGPGTSPYPASYARRPAEVPAKMPRFPVAFRLPAFASWSSIARWGTGPPLRSAYRPPSPGPDPNGVVTLHTHEIRPGWVPSLPRGLRCPYGQTGVSSRRTPLRSGQSLNPEPSIRQPGLRVTRHHRGFTAVHPSGLPLACNPADGARALGFPPSFTPRRYQRRTSEWGRAHGHLPGLRHRHQHVLLT
jgi:hypothetical protein